MQPTLDAMTRAVRAAHPTAPTRFAADVGASLRATARLRRALPRGRRGPPSGPRWMRFAQGLDEGDPPADTLAATLPRDGRRRVWGQFETALARGIGAVHHPTPELVAFFAAVERWPAWVDPDRLREGGRVCALGGRPAMAAMLVNALAGGYRLSAINQTLVSTGQLETSPGRRLGFTTRWFMDVTESDVLARTSAGFASTLRVRLIHALVRQRLRLGGWDRAALGLPINQVDMQATYLGFGSVYVLGMRMLGVPTTADERAAYLHRWRALAWLNGVQEKHLHPLGDEELGALELLHHNVLQQPQADESTPRLARPLLLDEPLTRAYPDLPGLRGRLVRAKGLSIARLGLGREGMQALGVPPGALPWYPLARCAVNQPLHRVVRGLPGGRARLERWGRAAQRAALAEVGSDGPALQHGSVGAG